MGDNKQEDMPPAAKTDTDATCCWQVAVRVDDIKSYDLHLLGGMETYDLLFLGSMMHVRLPCKGHLEILLWAPECATLALKMSRHQDVAQGQLTLQFEVVACQTLVDMNCEGGSSPEVVTVDVNATKFKRQDFALRAGDSPPPLSPPPPPTFTTFISAH
jgi:hypothetical protein